MAEFHQTPDITLPHGWALSTLDQICEDITDGDHQPPPIADSGIPFLVIGDIKNGQLDFSRCRHVPEHYYNHLPAKRKPDSNDLLYTVAGSFGTPVRIANDRPFCVQRHIAILKSPVTGTKDYLYHALGSQSVINQATATATGTAQKTVGLKSLRNFLISLPPLNEQRRIVAKIDALQARSNAAKQALDAIPPLLEAFRQSVLAAAFRGDLTATWREQNPDVEPASVLLQRIRAERKARFIAAAAEDAEAKARAKALAAGKPWSDADAADVRDKARAKAEAKYVEPEPVDDSELPELPEGWCWARLEELSFIESGQTPKDIDIHHVAEGDVNWYRVSDMNIPQNSTVMNIANITLPGSAAVALGLNLRPPGTLIFPKRGGAIATNKKRILGSAAAFDLNIMGIIPVADIGSWLVAWFNGIDLGKLADGTSVPQINHGDIKPLPVPLAPAKEQQPIIEAVQAALAIAQSLAAANEEQLGRLAALDQSILAKAFRGELVPQDPTDEPASALLDRIRAERSAPPPPRRTPPTPKPPPQQPQPQHLDLLSPPPDPTETMAHLRTLLRGRGAVDRETILQALATALGHDRITPPLRKRLDGQLLAAVRRNILESGTGEQVRLATLRVEDYPRDTLIGTLRAVTRRRCLYTRDDLSRSTLAHLGFRRLTKPAKAAIEAAIDAAVRSGLFERVDGQLRRSD